MKGDFFADVDYMALLEMHRIRVNELRKGNLLILEALNTSEQTRFRPLTVAGVFNIVAQITRLYFGTPTAGKNKKTATVIPRQITQYICKNHSSFSSSRIGYDTGGFDHATVLHNAKTVQNMIDTNYKGFYREMIKNIYTQLHAKYPHIKQNAYETNTNS